MKLKYFILLIVSALAFTSCNDDDTFSNDPSAALTFQQQTLNLDTVFANTLSAYKSFKIYNFSGDGLRISSVRQSKGADITGFMVNVNGSYINPDNNNQITDMEVRKGDSIRVFVEFKPKKMDDSETMKEITDDVIFTYESGTQQTLHLIGTAWNANMYHDLVISSAESPYSFPQGKPVVIYGMVKVEDDAVLDLNAGDTLYFHQDGGIDVRGNLNVYGTKDHEVLLRCDRLDSLLQVSYDNVPGKWQGIYFHQPSSKAVNKISYLTLHGSEYGMICDTTRLDIDHSTIHNISGVGIKSKESVLSLRNVQLSNACSMCLDITGGNVTVNSCTLASFYAYTSGREYALSFTDKNEDGNFTPLTLNIRNSLITGYSSDEVWYSPFKNDSTAEGIHFDHCLLRTEKPTGAYEKMMENCIFENTSDKTGGEGNFTTIDTYNFYYNFTPKATSLAVNAADPETSETDDRRGTPRKGIPHQEGSTDAPTIGCFEPAAETAEQTDK